MARKPKKESEKVRFDTFSAREGTKAKADRLAAVLTVKTGEKVSLADAVTLAIDEAMERYEKGGRR